MVVVAAFAVAAVWLVFDVAMPVPRLSTTREAAVYMWRDIPEAVEHMIRGNDPALFSPTLLHAEGVWDSLHTSYTPSWENGLPELRPLPNTAASPVSIWPALFSSEPPVVTAISPAKEPPVLTKIVFSETLTARNPSLPKFTPEGGARALPPMEFLVAVRDDGYVAHVFLLTSTAAIGALEETVTRLLYASTFSEQKIDQSDQSDRVKPLITPYTWGTVTFFWGNDQ